MKKYEVVILGAGPGGYQAALELGKAGVKVLLVDRAKEKVGGVCLNLGCIPTKNYLESAAFTSKIEHFKSCGLSLDYGGLNLQTLQEKTIELKTEIRTGVLWMLEQSKVELLFGEASFVDEKTIDVDGERVEFEKCVIATGSKVRELPQLPIDKKRVLSSDDIFDLNVMPKSIAIIGAGPIACEFATFFNAFGVNVTLIGRSSQLLPSEDEDVSKALTRVFKRSGINVMTSTTVAKTDMHDEGVSLSLNESEEKIECDLVLSATGRIPNCDKLNLEKTGVKRDERGFIEISPSFKTSQDNVYAIGDVVNTPAFAHTAYAEAKIVAKNILSSESNANSHLTPSTIFTIPQIASCGLKEKDAKEQGIEVEVSKAYYKANAKAKIHGDDSGFAKITLSKEGIILGATVIGVEATEIIHELLIAIENKITISELRKMIHAHPTVSEIITYL